MPLDARKIEKTIGKLRKLLKKAPKLPSPDDVHDLRTRARRIEATFEAAGLASKRNERRLLSRLKQMRKKAGKVRDMDVLTSHVSAGSLNSEDPSVITLVEYLARQRHRRARKLHESIVKHGAEARQRLKRAARRIRQIAAPGGSSDQSKEPATNAAAAALRLSNELAAVPTLRRSNLHPYRMKIKQLRYVLQAAENHGNRELLGALGKCKDAIGEWHDWQELVGIATKLFEDDPNCEALRKLREIQQQKYESALTMTNQMRRRYNYLHSTAQSTGAQARRPSQQALRAAATLAQ
jgi:CHAD domain-containing protein